MSHIPRRKEKDCLNCGTQVFGNFCHNCGQENIEPKESVWHLVSHFFQDMTHFDGKFFTSLRYLVLKPGFLSKQYIAGKRVSYLNPIRMYLFTSAIFFLIFFSLYQVDEKTVGINSSFAGKTSQEITKMDSTEFSEFTKKVNKGKPMTKAEVFARLDSGKFQLGPGNYRSKEAYDSVLKAGVKKHNWFERQMIYKNIELKEKYNSKPQAIIAALINKFTHLLPQMLFVLLPLFALILKLVYIRRKQFYYVDHVIFTIHLYIFIFLVMLVSFGISKLKNLLHWSWLSYLVVIFVLSTFFYFYKALRNFYKQRRAKTILKYFILVFLFFIITLLMFIVFLFFSIFGL
ncbi:MAG TPA: DUF3667 domain-containing protein [Chitinophagaceae bacterium]|nr:DUF3667 domain-containing protein [Chitinophagaceae bacterium]